MNVDWHGRLMALRIFSRVVINKFKLYKIYENITYILISQTPKKKKKPNTWSLEFPSPSFHILESSLWMLLASLSLLRLIIFVVKRKRIQYT